MYVVAACASNAVSFVLAAGKQPDWSTGPIGPSPGNPAPGSSQTFPGSQAPIDAPTGGSFHPSCASLTFKACCLRGQGLSWERSQLQACLLLERAQAQCGSALPPASSQQASSLDAATACALSCAQPAATATGAQRSALHAGPPGGFSPQQQQQQQRRPPAQQAQRAVGPPAPRRSPGVL